MKDTELYSQALACIRSSQDYKELVNGRECRDDAILDPVGDEPCRLKELTSDWTLISEVPPYILECATQNLGDELNDKFFSGNSFDGMTEPFLIMSKALELPSDELILLNFYLRNAIVSDVRAARILRTPHLEDRWKSTLPTPCDTSSSSS